MRADQRSGAAGCVPRTHPCGCGNDGRRRHSRRRDAVGLLSAAPGTGGRGAAGRGVDHSEWVGDLGEQGPTGAVALLLALATDTRAGRLTLCDPRQISPDLGQVGLLPGSYRIPAAVAPMLRAALLDHQARGLPAYALFSCPTGGLLLSQRMASLITRAATVTGLPRPVAATATGRSDSGPEPPFGAALINSGAVRIDDADP